MPESISSHRKEGTSPLKSVIVDGIGARGTIPEGHPLRSGCREAPEIGSLPKADWKQGGVDPEYSPKDSCAEVLVPC